MKSRKIRASSLAVAAALLISLTGTFAWTLTSNPSLMELTAASTGTEYGGRLHDDYDSASGGKWIYVENYGRENIYARVKLTEYYEVGGASVESGAAKADKTTWTTRQPGATTGIAARWTWGQTGELTTAYQVTDSTITEADAQEPAHNGTASGGYTSLTVNDTTIRNTETGTVITMAEYASKDKATFKGWVVDTDGWAYWSQPISAGTATAPLLNKVTRTDNRTVAWYYGINAEAQFITANDMIAGFTGDTPTANAKTLLSNIGVETDWQVGDEVTLDGVTFIVADANNALAGTDGQNHNAVLLLSKNALEKKAFRDETNDPAWNASTLRTYLNGSWLTGKSEIESHVIEVTNKTRKAFDATTFVDTNDKAFLLTTADLFGQYYDGSVWVEATAVEDYTKGTADRVALFDDWTTEDMSSAIATDADGTAVWWWLRSPVNATNPAYVNASGGHSGDNASNAGGVRPAFWYDLEA